MTDDVRLLLVRLDEPVLVRPAFADSLRTALHAELGFGPAPVPADVAGLDAPVTLPAPVSAGRPSLVERLVGAFRPMTPRVALLVALALLLIACTVAGAWIVASGWVSSAPRGPQYTNDFTFNEAYRGEGTSFTSLQLGPDGQSMYSIAQTMEGDHRTDPTVVRFDVAGEGLAATDVVHLESLTDPALWPAGTDPTNGRIALGPANAGTSPIAVAPNGDLFVGIELSTDPERATASNGIVVVHPNGTAGRVVSLDDLVTAGLIDHPLDGGWVTVAASAPDRIWAKAEGWKMEGKNSDGGAWLFEITDPTADGDWTDKVVRPIVLPADVPQVEWGAYAWQYGGFVAEPSQQGRDRRDAILLTLIGSDEYRVYRLTDPDGDGDVTAAGGTELVYGGPLSTADGRRDTPLLAPRVVGAGEQPVIDELVTAGLTRSTRVSRIAGAAVTDILRALPPIAWGIAATRDGSIYVASFDDAPNGAASAGAGVILRLAPVPVGAAVPLPSSSTDPSPSAGSSSPAPATSVPAGSAAAGAASPDPATTSLLPARRPLTAGVPRIAVWYGGSLPSGDWTNEHVLYGADGSGPSDLLPGTRHDGLCPSADGARMAFWSDEEVPNEQYAYIDAVGGGARTKVTETAQMLICPFPDEGIVTLETTGTPWRATWHPTDGDATPLSIEIPVDGVLATSNDGAWLAVASGTGGQTLTAVDVRTGAVTGVVDFPDRVRRAAWSPDGARLVVATGRYDPMDPDAAGTFALWVVDRAGGTPRPLGTVTGRAPSLAWSPDGASISVNARNGASDCCFELGDLQVIDVATGAARDVVKDALFGAWSPVDPSTFAYATKSTLFIETAGAPVREIPGPTGKLCPTCRDRATPEWPAFGAGWSPDGRYIATGDPVVGIVDVASGTYSILVTDGDNALVYGSRWMP